MHTSQISSIYKPQSLYICLYRAQIMQEQVKVPPTVRQVKFWMVLRYKDIYTHLYFSFSKEGMSP